MHASAPPPSSIDATLSLLQSQGYVADRALATVLFLALRMKRPLLLEGEAGTGKTEIAKVLAAALGRRLIRLQCYEGLDLASAVYEWNYAGQMMAIRLAEAGGVADDRERLESDIFSERYLVKRPLLQALEPQEGEAQVSAFLERHPQFRREPVQPAEIGGLTDAIDANGDIRTLPHQLGNLSARLAGWTGFYASRLIRL